MVTFLLGVFRLIWLFGKGHHGIVLENLVLRQQLSIYKRKQKRPRLSERDRWLWATLSLIWKNWRQALVVVHPDTVVRWQRERFRGYWANLSKKPTKLGRPPIPSGLRGLIQTMAETNPLWRAPRIAWRATEVRHGGIGADGFAHSAHRETATLPDLEDLPAESLERDSRHRLLHGSDDTLACIVCVSCDGASTQESAAFRCDRKPDG